MENYLILVPIIGILGLLMAFWLYSYVGKQDSGNDKMREICAAISEGAHAFLFAEYKVLIIFVLVVFIIIGIATGQNSWLTAICFLIGSLFSTLAGYLGMSAATKANARTAAAAKDHGMSKALSIAFSGGSVMGFAVVGLGLFGVSIIYFITKNVVCKYIRPFSLTKTDPGSILLTENMCPA